MEIDESTLVHGEGTDTFDVTVLLKHVAEAERTDFVFDVTNPQVTGGFADVESQVHASELRSFELEGSYSIAGVPEGNKRTLGATEQTDEDNRTELGKDGLEFLFGDLTANVTDPHGGRRDVALVDLLDVGVHTEGVGVLTFESRGLDIRGSKLLG